MSIHRIRWRARLLPPLLSVALAGCGTYGARGAARFEVQANFLDHVTFTFLEAGGASPGDAPVLVRITLSGSGHAHYAKGRSSRVHDPFWSDRTEKFVDDLFTDQLVLDEQQVREVLQALVNAGVFDRKKQGRHIADPRNDHVLIRANIGDRRAVVVTDAPDVVGIFTDLAARFAR